MRTTIDLPDSLVARVKDYLAKRKVSLRTLVIIALEREIDHEPPSFTLRDCSVSGSSSEVVSTEEINGAIDELRETPFRP